MSAELEAFRRHARRMVTAGHRPDCRGRAEGPSPGCGNVSWEVYPRCPGCVSDRDRVLWAQLADEADRFAVPVEVPS